jgi:hypothetical protein
LLRGAKVKKAGPFGLAFAFCGWQRVQNLMSSAESNAGSNLADSLIDKSNRRFPVPTLVRFSGLQFCPGILKQPKRGIHVGLRPKRVANTQARCHGKPNKQFGTRVGSQHEVLQHSVVSA